MAKFAVSPDWHTSQPPPGSSPLPNYPLETVCGLEVALGRALSIIKSEPQPAPNLVRHVGELLIGFDGPDLPGETEVVLAAMSVGIARRSLQAMNA